MATEPRRPGWNTRWRRALRGLALAGTGFVANAAAAEPPNKLPANLSSTPVRAPSQAAKQIVAYVHGNVPITREELHDFLISRGGMDKIDKLVIRKLVEVEAARRNISVTPEEVEAGLAADLVSLRVSRSEFEKLVLPRYKTTLFEWQYDVIRPRLLLGKMCRDRVSVAEDELRRLYEHRYGEKREAQVIIWTADLPAEKREAARTNPAEFDKLATTQPDRELAAAGGRINPVGRHLEGEDPKVEQALFSLKPGEVSPWIQTAKGVTCLRLLTVVPPNTMVTFEQARPGLEHDLIERKTNAEIPKLFESLKKAADPKLTVHVPVPPQPAAPAGKPAPPPPVRVPCADPHVLAYIYGTFPVTREDLGEFLIIRGGHAKLELLVNKRIIEMEAAHRGVSVSPEEIENTLTDDLRGLGLAREVPGASPADVAKQMKADFVQQILPTYGRSLFEWTEDVLKPRVLLGKMCRDRVKVTDDDVKKAFENHYGEKREAKIIIWPKEDSRQALKQWDELRKGDDPAAREANFDRIARGQRDPNLAAAAGKVAPIGRHTDAENPVIEQVVFSLKVGDVSHLFETSAGIMCVKCTGIVSASTGVSFEKERPRLEQEVFKKKMARAIPAFFGELKQKAEPNILLKGPPTPKENEEGVRQLIDQLQQAGGFNVPKK